MTHSTPQPMIYFNSLELENVRCFGERQVLELTDDQGRPARWTLLLGDNGVGKTTLLQCLAWMRPVPLGDTGGDTPGGEKPSEIQPDLTDEEDEIDLHLHPRWQRQVVTDLTQHFPRTQFIATAHSPLIVQSATDANLVVLQQKDGQVEIKNQPHFVESWRADQILTSELFDIPARSPRIQDLIDERYGLLDKTERTPREEQRLQELDEELDNLPTGSHEDNEAMDIIRQAAVLIKEHNSQEP